MTVLKPAAGMNGNGFLLYGRPSQRHACRVTSTRRTSDQSLPVGAVSATLRVLLAKVGLKARQTSSALIFADFAASISICIGFTTATTLLPPGVVPTLEVSKSGLPVIVSKRAVAGSVTALSTADAMESFQTVPGGMVTVTIDASPTMEAAVAE